MLLNILIITLTLLVFAVFLNALRSKDLLIKILMLNNATSIASLLICALGTYQANSSYIDIAVIYFMLSIVSSAAYLKFFLQKKEKEMKNE